MSINTLKIKSIYYCRKALNDYILQNLGSGSTILKIIDKEMQKERLKHNKFTNFFEE